MRFSENFSLALSNIKSSKGRAFLTMLGIIIGISSVMVIIGLGNGHMYPAFQTMFINLAEHRQRGTANSTLSTSWDTGVGLGTFFGGLAAEYAGYAAAFWLAWAVNFIGVAYYFLRIRPHFEANKLR